MHMFWNKIRLLACKKEKGGDSHIKHYIKAFGLS